MKHAIFSIFLLLFVSVGAEAEWYPHRDWNWTDSESSAQTAALNRHYSFAYVLFIEKEGECQPYIAAESPTIAPHTNLEIDVDGEIWSTDSPYVTTGESGSSYVMNWIGDDLLVAIQNGSLMLISTSDGIYRFSLTGSARAIQLAAAVCRGQEAVYGPHIPKSQLSSRVNNSNSFVVIGEEEITRGYAQRAIRKIENSGANFIIVDSSGGLIDEAMELGRWIREQGLDTAVAQSCASACVEVFAGGQDRRLNPGAQIGIHQISTTDAANDSAKEGQYWVAEGANYFLSMGVDSEIVIARSTVPPEQMKWLTWDEADSWNLVTGFLDEYDQSRIPPVTLTSRWEEYDSNSAYAATRDYDWPLLAVFILMFSGAVFTTVRINQKICR